jgi:hypothetical protein
MGPSLNPQRGLAISLFMGPSQNPQSGFHVPPQKTYSTLRLNILCNLWIIEYLNGERSSPVLDWEGLQIMRILLIMLSVICGPLFIINC